MVKIIALPGYPIFYIQIKEGLIYAKIRTNSSYKSGKSNNQKEIIKIYHIKKNWEN